MSKKKASRSKKIRPTQKGQVSKPVSSASFAWMPWAASAVALLVFSTGFQNEMVAMDDHTATVNNPAVRKFSVVFDGMFNLGMYAPLTWLMYGVAYAIGKDDPFWYHLMSALVHSLNTALVWLVLQKLGARPWQTLFVALAFAVHPIQVEAVSWIAAFSAPFSTTFFLLATWFYLRYVDAGAYGRDYWLVVVCMLAACLAKSATVVLPVTLLALDVWLKRPLSLKTLAEKSPLFALSLVFGLLTLYSRTTTGHTVNAGGFAFGLIDRFLMANHSILFYWGKLLWPTGFSIWYPFEKLPSGAWHWTYYASPFVLAAFIWTSWRYRSIAPVLWVGILYFLANIFLAMPFYTIGQFELRSDRYNYLACLGIFAILAALPAWQPVVQRHLSTAVSGFLALLLVVWTALSIRRIADWRDTITLIEQAMKVEGDYFGKAYLWRGMAYGDAGKGKEALENFNLAVARDSTLYEAYKYRGALLGIAKQYEQSVADLNKYLEKYPNDEEYYYNRGLSLLNLGRIDEAMADFNKTLQLNPQFAPAYRSRGNVYLELGERDKGEADLRAWEQTRWKMKM